MISFSYQEIKDGKILLVRVTIVQNSLTIAKLSQGGCLDGFRV